MKRILVVGAVLASCIFFDGFSAAVAQPLSTWGAITQRFINRDCEKNNSCGLLQFTVISESYKVYTEGQPNLGIRAYIEYETDKVESLPEYAIVQFLRGCQFKSVKNKDGTVKKYNTSSIKSFDEYHTFHFPTWTIDSVDKDPIYLSSDGQSAADRIAKYLWHELPWQWPRTKVGVNRYKIPNPPMPRLHVTDRPGPVFRGEMFAYNSSLQFRTCVYRTKDIPSETTRDNTKFADPITCLAWASSFLYNFDTGEFDSPEEIDPFCLDPAGVKIFK